MSNEQLIRQTWGAIAEGDLTALEAVLASEARWRAVEDGPWNCQNRDAILARMKTNRDQRGLKGNIEEVADYGGRAIVAFRPDLEAQHQWDEPWPLSDGVRYMVVTMHDGLIDEIKGCADREVALAYAQAS
jgi:Domain of unknown function (DUF4440)